MVRGRGVAALADGAGGMKRPSAIKNRWIKVWNAAREQLEERGDWDETAAALLERFVLNLMEAENALKQASAEPFTAGSQGQMVAHPGFGVAKGCEQAALSAARQLMLTPATKPKGGEDTGDEAQADDPLAALDELAARRASKHPA